MESPQPEPAVLAREDGDQQLVTDLAAFCQSMGPVVADRSRALQLRIRDAEHQLREQDHDQWLRIERFLDPASEGPRERFYTGIIEAAAARGVRFECPDAERVLTLLAAGDDDIDGASIPSGPEDLANLCRVAREFSTTSSSPAERSVQLAVAIDETIRHPELRMALDALTSASADERYELLRHAARELGAPDWECPELEALWSSSSP